MILNSLNEIAEYIYKLTSIYNKFYSENKILTEENIDLRESWLTLSKVVYDTNMLLLNTVELIDPEKNVINVLILNINNDISFIEYFLLTKMNNKNYSYGGIL